MNITQKEKMSQTSVKNSQSKTTLNCDILYISSRQVLNSIALKIKNHFSYGESLEMQRMMGQVQIHPQQQLLMMCSLSSPPTRR